MSLSDNHNTGMLLAETKDYVERWIDQDDGMLIVEQATIEEQVTATGPELVMTFRIRGRV